MNTHGRWLLLLLAMVAACHRNADEFDDVPPQDELADLRVDACEALCSTMDRCDPDRFEGEDPPICFDRCMELSPLYEENQCGSRELQWMNCVGDLTCEQFHQWDIALRHHDYYFDYECVAELGRASECDEDDPFDMDEDNSQYP